MNERERVALFDRLCGIPAETEWFDCRRRRYDAYDQRAR